MMGIKRHIYAAGISGGILLLVLLMAYMKFASYTQLPEEEYLVEMKLEKPKAEEKKPEEPQKKTTAKLTHKALNSQLKTQQHTEADNYQTLEEMTAKQQPLTTEELKEKLKEPVKESPALETIRKSAEQTRKAKEAAENRKANIAMQGKAVSNASDRAATISYSLVGRIAISTLPNPVYTCPSGGKVVINILVDDQGNVVDATPNKSSSTTTDECLVENALRYARRTKFNANLQKDSQIGTITYLFQDK